MAELYQGATAAWGYEWEVKGKATCPTLDISAHRGEKEEENGDYLAWAFPFSLTYSPFLPPWLTEHMLHSGPGFMCAATPVRATAEGD